MIKKKSKHPWDRWFASDEVTLKLGVDFASTKTMCELFRRQSQLRGISAVIETIRNDEGVFLYITFEKAERPTREPPTDGRERPEFNQEFQAANPQTDAEKFTFYLNGLEWILERGYDFQESPAQFAKLIRQHFTYMKMKKLTRHDLLALWIDGGELYCHAYTSKQLRKFYSQNKVVAAKAGQNEEDDNHEESEPDMSPDEAEQLSLSFRDDRPDDDGPGDDETSDQEDTPHGASDPQ